LLQTRQERLKTIQENLDQIIGQCKNQKDKVH